MAERITHYHKALYPSNSNGYGFIRVYFGQRNNYHDFKRLSLIKFLTISHLLEHDEVAYDRQNDRLITPTELAEVENLMA